MPHPDAAPPADRTMCARPTTSARWTFIRTESGSAAVLVAAAVAALIWANAAPGSYADVWHTHLSVELGDHGLSLDLREWVNSGLMTVFFLVIGLEVRREFDMGELRELNRVTLPFMAGLAGMLVPVLIFLGFTAGDSSASGWGVAMSTDTAFALGMLALLGKRFPRRLYTFVLTIAVVDDFVVLAVIAFVYSDSVRWPPLLIGAAFFAAIVTLRSSGSRRGPVYAALGVAMWLAFEESGVDPVVVGLLIGIMTFAYPAPRSELERASGLFRSFREQPTPELEREARQGIASAISPNERLLRMYHPWSSYLVVPLFALANTGIQLGGDALSGAATSPLTLGIFLAFVVGKPLGVVGATALTTWLSKGRLRPPVGWASVAGGGAITGIGFTIAVLIATMAFDGEQLEEAKIGILAAVLGSVLVTGFVALVTTRLPQPRRTRALLGTAPAIVDLAAPVDPGRDHIRGPLDAPVTVVEYGDFECPYCGRAEPVVRNLLADFGDVRYVWRHLPLTDVHPRAQLAAEAGEAAAEQDAFWPMHDRLLAHQDQLKPGDLLRHAAELALDVERFRRSLHARSGAGRVSEDTESADLSGVAGTPTFFVNGRRHHGAYDIGSLSAAVRAARDRVTLDEQEA